MSPVLNDMLEPDEPSRDEREVEVCVTVPEEFTGVSLHEIVARGGSIAGIDVQQHGVLIRGSLPVSEYQTLAEAVTAGTQGRGRVTREN